MTKPLDSQGVDGGVGKVDVQAAYKQGFIDALATYAINKDGRLLVGSCGVTLKSAVENAETAWNYSPPEGRPTPDPQILVEAKPAGWQHWIKAHMTTPDHARQVQEIAEQMFPDEFQKIERCVLVKALEDILANEEHGCGCNSIAEKALKQWRGG